LAVPDLGYFGWAGGNAARRSLDLTVPDLRNFGRTRTGGSTYDGVGRRYGAWCWRWNRPGARLVWMTGSLNLTVPNLGDLGWRRRTPIRTGKPFAFFLDFARIFPLAFAAGRDGNRMRRLANLRTGFPIAWF
jgi:hypothetical protein